MLPDDDDDELLKWVDELIEAQEELEILNALEKSKRWLNRRWHVHDYHKGRQRKQDFYDTAFQELKNFPDKFKDLMRMKPDTFLLLLRLTESNISPLHKTETAILAEQRLALTIMYLAHGTDVAYLSLTNRIAKSTIYKIINKTCEGIFEALSPLYLKFPDVTTWRNIAKKFGEYWQMPGCLSAIDGKHVLINAPDNSGTLFFNYKKLFSIVLMAGVNYNLEFTWVDIGQPGGQSDGGVLSRSSFGQDLERGTLEIPREEIQLPNSNIRVPHYFVGDEAFKLRQDFMKPYPGQNLTEDQKIFNYRLSRARRCVESAFGILVMRWRILEKRIRLNPDTVESIVKACVCLHNFLSTLNETDANIDNYKLNQERAGADLFEDEYDVLDNREGYNVREKLTNYFVGAGQVPWQLERVRRGLNIPNEAP